jgi:hypothetical protein
VYLTLQELNICRHHKHHVGISSTDERLMIYVLLDCTSTCWTAVFSFCSDCTVRSTSRMWSIMGRNVCTQSIIHDAHITMGTVW